MTRVGSQSTQLLQTFLNIEVMVIEKLTLAFKSNNIVVVFIHQ